MAPNAFNADALRAVVFDWCGTTIDFGCKAPTRVFMEAYAAAGVEITEAEAREPMGRPKRDHVAAIFAMDRVREAWKAAKGNYPGEEAIDQVYEQFVPLQAKVIGAYTQPIPGTLEVVDKCRQMGLKVGSNTGYPRAIMDVVLPGSAREGYEPDCCICADDVPSARPAPLMLYAAMIAMDVWPASAVVKVDDTVPGIHEGLNAGSWAVGLALTGNETGLDLEELEALSPEERGEVSAKAHEKLKQAGAHYVIDGIWDLPDVLKDINERLARGESPTDR